MRKVYSIYQIALRSFTAGGTLKSAEELLPFVAENGFDFVYLCPVFAADPDSDVNSWSKRQRASGTYNPKNPYKMYDYFNVDVEYGTNADLKDFVDTAHSLGLRVMLDLVYLHCGVNAVFAQKHPEYLVCGEDGKPIVGADWPFARINYDCEGVREYLYSNMEYYVRDFGVDGYRCDVGDAVPLDFWSEGAKRIHMINPDAVMLNEGHNPETTKEVFDLCYEGYNIERLLFEEDITGELKGQKEYREVYKGKYVSFQENHDIASDAGLYRKEIKFGHKLMDIGFFLMYTLDGVPMLFNGNEIGDSAEQCMFSNRFHGKRAGIDWSNLLREHGKRRLELIRNLNALKREHEALVTGETVIKESGNRKLLIFERVTENEKLTVVVNRGTESVEAELGVNKKALLCNEAVLENDKVKLGAYGYAVVEE